jgi:hypothetical protein
MLVQDLVVVLKFSYILVKDLLFVLKFSYILVQDATPLIPFEGTVSVVDNATTLQGLIQVDIR